MAWTAETAPPPYFGVAAGGEPTVAHCFGVDGRSVCGVQLRLMASEAETQLVTCPACVEKARAEVDRDRLRVAIAQHREHRYSSEGDGEIVYKSDRVLWAHLP